MKIRVIGISARIGMVVALLGFVVLSPSIVWAHAFPEAEHPRVGSTVSSPPARVSIKYDAPIQSLFSKLEVLNSSGKAVTIGGPEVGRSHRRLSIKLQPLKPGNYTVKWSVVAEDGHRTEGSYGFTLAARKLKADRP